MSAKKKLKSELIVEVAQLQKRIKELESADPQSPGKKSGSVWREFAESSTDHMIILGLDLTIEFINHTIIGFTKDDLIGKRITKFLNVEQANYVEKVLMDAIKNGAPAVYETEFQDPAGKGETQFYEARAVPRLLAGKVIGLILYSRDNTIRKKNEKEIKDQRDKIQSIFRSAPIGIGMVSNRILLHANNFLCEMIGYLPEELINQDAKILYPTEKEYDYVGEEKYRQIKLFGVGTVETRFKRKSGEMIDVLLSSSPIDPEDLSAGVTFSALDITDRVQTEQSLKTATTIINSSPTVAFSWINENGWPVEFVTENVDQLCGYTAEEFLTRAVVYEDLIVGDDLARVTEEVEISDKGEAREFILHTPYRITTKSGEIKWVSDKTSISRDSGGNIRSYQGVVFDITREVKANEALQRRTQELDSLLKSSRALNSSLDMSEVMQIITNSAADLTGVDSVAIYLLKESDLFLGATTPPLDLDFPASFRRAALDDHPYIKTCISSRKPVVLADTKTADFSAAERAISDARGLKSIVYFPIAIEDLILGVLILGTIDTRRIFSEDELKLSLTLTNHIAISLHNSILHDETTKYLSALEDQIHEREKTEYQKDLLLLQVQEANERLKILSRELINSQEEERKRISQELHDELGQALTGISLDLGIIEKNLHPDTPRDIKERLADTRKNTDALDQMIGELALDLRPSLLDDLGLLPTLNWYVDRYSKRTDVEVDIEISGQKMRLPTEVETALYRIIQEALTNVIKHAQAKKVILGFENKPEGVIVSITDDGIGFNFEDLQNEQPPIRGLGLLGMADRTALLGGNIDINSKPGAGTRIKVEIPL